MLYLKNDLSARKNGRGTNTSRAVREHEARTGTRRSSWVASTTATASRAPRPSEQHDPEAEDDNRQHHERADECRKVVCHVAGDARYDGADQEEERRERREKPTRRPEEKRDPLGR